MLKSPLQLLYVLLLIVILIIFVSSVEDRHEAEPIQEQLYDCQWLRVGNIELNYVAFSVNTHCRL